MVYCCFDSYLLELEKYFNGGHTLNNLPKCCLVLFTLPLWEKISESCFFMPFTVNSKIINYSM